MLCIVDIDDFLGFLDIAKAIMEDDETQKLLESSYTNKVELPGLTWVR